MVEASDTKENIEQCLNCRRVECDNCIGKPPRSKGSHRPVARCDPKTGEILTVYNSIRQAEKLTCVSRVSIYRCLDGLQKTAGGYAWKESI